MVKRSLRAPLTRLPKGGKPLRAWRAVSAALQRSSKRTRIVARDGRSRCPWRAWRGQCTLAHREPRVSKIDVLSGANLPPFLMDPLRAAFLLHERTHQTHPAA